MNSRVLITRDPQRATALVERLATLGVTAICEPVTRTVFADHDQPPPRSESFRWIAFTSVNAVVAYSNATSRESTAIAAATRIAAVGAATSSEVARRFRTPDLVAADANATELAESLLNMDHELPGTSLLWPCAAKTTERFQIRLQDAGVHVTPWVCYSTESVTPETLAPGLASHRPWDAVLFAAPSAVKAFHAALPAPWDFECVAIGNITATALLRAGADRLTVCAGISVQDQVDAILIAVGCNKARAQISEDAA